MPHPDITLEDIQKLFIQERGYTQHMIDSSVQSSEQRILRHFDDRLEETHTATLELFGVVLDQLDEHSARFDQMDERFAKMDERLDRMDERFDRMDERFNQLQTEVKATNRLVRRHSQDIMELRAAS